MNKNIKILENYEHICLFCGKEIEGRYEEYEKYYECECENAVKDRDITEKIRSLERQRPSEKFRISKKYVLSEVKNLEI